MSTAGAIRAGAAYVELFLNDSQFARGLKNVQGQLAGAAREFMNIGKGFLAVGAAGTTFFGGAAAVYADFEQALIDASLLIETNSDGLITASQAAERFEKVYRNLGRTTSKTASEVALGARQLAQMGMSADLIEKNLASVVAAAELTEMSVVDMAREAVTAVNAMGRPLEELPRTMDIIAKAAFSSSANITEMGQAFGYIAGAAKIAGEPVEDIAAMFSILADNGIRGERAGTSIRGMLLQLADAPPKAQKQLKALGVEIHTATGEFVGMRNIIQQLEEGFPDMSARFAKAEAIAKIFDLRQATGAAALLSTGTAKFDEQILNVLESKGFAIQLAKERLDSLRGSFIRLMSVINEAAISIGGSIAPELSAIVEKITEAIRVVSEFIDENKWLIKILAGSSAALVAVGGGLFSFGLSLSVMSSAIGVALRGGYRLVALLRGMAFLLAAPFLSVPTLVGAAITAAIGGLLLLSKEFRKFVTDTYKKFSQIGRGLIEAFRGMIQAFIQGEWRLGIEIALKGLQLAFLKLQLYIRSNWKRWLSNMAVDFVNMFIGLTNVLNKFAAGMANTLAKPFAAMAEAIRGNWRRAAALLAEVTFAAGQELAKIGEMIKEELFPDNLDAKIGMVEADIQKLLKRLAAIIKLNRKKLGIYDPDGGDRTPADSLLGGREGVRQSTAGTFVGQAAPFIGGAGVRDYLRKIEKNTKEEVEQTKEGLKVNKKLLKIIEIVGLARV